MKVIKAELKIDPLQEAQREVAERIRKDKPSAKAAAAFDFSESMELDERKWDAASLRQALQGFILYDLKIVAVALGDCIDQAAKQNKALSVLVDKTVSDFRRSVEKKLLNGLDELKTDAGPTKKAAKTLKDALKACQQSVRPNMFTAPVVEMKKFVAQLRRMAAADASGGDKSAQREAQARRKADLAPSLRSFDKIVSDFSKASKAAETAVQNALNCAKQMKKDKDVDPAIARFSAILRDQEHVFEEFIDACKSFDKEVGALKSALGGSEISASELNEIEKSLDTLAKADGRANSIRRLAGTVGPGVKKSLAKLNLK